MKLDSKTIGQAAQDAATKIRDVLDMRRPDKSFEEIIGHAIAAAMLASLTRTCVPDELLPVVDLAAKEAVADFEKWKREVMN